jgi:nucleoside phosphorylase
MFTFLSLMFGIGALALFAATFSFIAKGRIGTAIAFGVGAVIMAGIAGGLVTAID